MAGGYLLTNARLIDGNGGPPQADRAVLVQDSMITWIGALADAPTSGQHTPLVDLGGRTVLPGFIDTHVHFTLPGAGASPLAAAQQHASYRILGVLGRLRATLHNGVTTARDLMGVDAGFREAVAHRLVEGPRLLVAVTMLSQTAGHADFTLPGGVDLLPLAVTLPGAPPSLVDSVDAVRARVRSLVAAGADCVKLAASGGVTSPHDEPGWLGMRPEMIAAVVQEARDYGALPVAVHAIGRAGIEAAVHNGATSIEHGYELDDDLRAAMVAQGQFLVPTLLETMQALDPATTSPQAHRKSERWHALAHESLARSVAAGVKVAMGTDAGIGPAHGANLGELDLLVRIGGMTPLQAITAGTRTGAELCGIADHTGTIEPGKAADLVVTPVDPLHDIAALADPTTIHLVLKDGRLAIDRAAIVPPGAIPPMMA